MERRLQLQADLEQILGSKNVYFQPPSSFQMIYPCIRYELDEIDAKHADNRVYTKKKAYLVTYVTEDPDDDLSDEMFGAFQMIHFDRHYTADNLHHFVYKIYY